jgi:integrase
MLSTRRRGKAQIIYIRGSVRLGDKAIIVSEHSTGTSSEDAASHLMAELETELREQLMFGSRAVAVRAVLADAFDAYLSKAPKPHSTDVVRIGVLNDWVGEMSLGNVKAAWSHFREGYLLGHAPAGQDRYRSLLQACVNVYHDKHDLPAFKLKAIPYDNERIRFLSHVDRDRLIESYAARIRPIATMLAFQGPRTQEALQLRWGIGGADMERRTLFFERTKTGNPRTVAMHPRVEAVLQALWLRRGQPTSGHVFLTHFGVPYTDTRDLPVQGGNPIWKSHQTACGRASIEDFRVHDWRHHWASHCVMAGVDLPTLMRLGGWKSLRMVQRYAAVDTAHMQAAVLKLV